MCYSNILVFKSARRKSIIFTARLPHSFDNIRVGHMNEATLIWKIRRTSEIRPRHGNKQTKLCWLRDLRHLRLIQAPCKNRILVGLYDTNIHIYLCEFMNFDGAGNVCVAIGARSVWFDAGLIMSLNCVSVYITLASK